MIAMPTDPNDKKTKRYMANQSPPSSPGAFA